MKKLEGLIRFNILISPLILRGSITKAKRISMLVNAVTMDFTPSSSNFSTLAPLVPIKRGAYFIHVDVSAHTLNLRSERHMIRCFFMFSWN